MPYCLCSGRSLLLLFLISAVPAAYIISLELTPPSTHVFTYHSSGFFRECSKWDDLNRRFIVSFFENGLGEIRVPDGDDQSSGGVLEEVTVVKDVDLAGNSSLGIAFDRPRNRVLVAVADVLRNKYSALAAYDLSTWKRLFLTQLSGPSDAKAFADDVAVDPEGNAYVTDVVGSQIWKVGKDGELLTPIKSPLFIQKQWYQNLVGLNGIVYHPDGFLLVVHTFSGKLFKVDLSKDEESVKLVNVNGGSLIMGDGILLLSPSKLVVAGNPSGRLVESSDGWESASIVGKFKGPTHRLASAATLKDGKVYLNHLVGMGYPKKKHAIVEAVFSN
ncbi:Calcium-dependent phosphotriesterase superfamily protein [Euphorbia peplus]|nr:Calcium-dependent phosphotriesterase superfamily protein [Euphorbia peplus]